MTDLIFSKFFKLGYFAPDDDSEVHVTCMIENRLYLVLLLYDPIESFAEGVLSSILTKQTFRINKTEVSMIK